MRDKQDLTQDMKSTYQQNVNPEQMLKIIFDYTAKIASTNDLDQVLMYMADMGREMIAADRCTVWVLDRERQQLWTRVAHGVEEIRMPATAVLLAMRFAPSSPCLSMTPIRIQIIAIC